MNGQQLKNSILQMAVEGKLVPQNENDEPASILIDRIAKEKEQLVKDKKIKKDKNISRIFQGEDDGLWYEKIGKGEIKCIEGDLPFRLPMGWNWCRLKSIVYNNGQLKPSTEFCYIDIGSINNITQKLSEDENIVKSENAPSRARKIVLLNDILYSTVRPYLHNMCIIDREFSLQPIASTGFAVMSCCLGIFNKYLFNYLLSPYFDNYANHIDNSKGVTYPAINDERLYKALIPLPPLVEQQRIVSKIEELLPLVDDYGVAHSKLEKLNSNFPNDLKKSLLQWAVQGKLVPQDENDEPASILIDRIAKEKEQLVKDKKIKKDKNLSRVFQGEYDGLWYEEIGKGEIKCIEEELPFDLPMGWSWCRLGSIGFLQTGTTPPTSNELFFNGNMPFIKPADITEYKIDYYNDSLSELGIEKSRLIEKNSILMVCIGGSMGKCAINNRPVCCNQQINSITPYLVYFKYLAYAMSCDYFQIYMKNHSGGTATPIYNKSMWGELLIPLPPLDEQHRIVEKLESVLSEIEKL